MSDYISRADAIEAVHKYFVDKINNEPHEIDEDGDDVFTDMKSVNALFHHNKMVSKAIKALPSAEPKGDLISRADVLKYPIRLNHYDEENGSREFVYGVESVIEFVESLPSADAVEVDRTSEWVAVRREEYEDFLASAEAESDDLIIKGAKGIKDGLYNIKDGKLFMYKANGGTVRTYPIVPSADAVDVAHDIPEYCRWSQTYTNMVQSAMADTKSADAEPKWNCTANFVAEQLERLKDMTDEERIKLLQTVFPSADAKQGFRGGKIPPKEMLDGTVLIPKHQWLEMERELAELKEKFESADAVPRWIPCSERLPKINQRVLLATNEKRVFVGYKEKPDIVWRVTEADGREHCVYDPENYTDNIDVLPKHKDCGFAKDDVYADGFLSVTSINYDDKFEGVIAWMPLPKPYREDGEA